MSKQQGDVVKRSIYLTTLVKAHNLTLLVCEGNRGPWAWPNRLMSHSWSLIGRFSGYLGSIIWILMRWSRTGVYILLMWEWFSFHSFLYELNDDDVIQMHVKMFHHKTLTAAFNRLCTCTTVWHWIKKSRQKVNKSTYDLRQEGLNECEFSKLKGVLNATRYKTVELHALNSWKEGQLNLAHGIKTKT